MQRPNAQCLQELLLLLLLLLLLGGVLPCGRLCCAATAARTHVAHRAATSPTAPTAHTATHRSAAKRPGCSSPWLVAAAACLHRTAVLGRAGLLVGQGGMAMHAMPAAACT